MNVILLALTLSKARVSKAWSNVCQMMIRRDQDASFESFQSLKTR